MYAEAQALNAAHAERRGSRSLDVLHVAAAAALGAKTFYTFDTRERVLALKAGMKVMP